MTCKQEQVQGDRNTMYGRQETVTTTLSVSSSPPASSPKSKRVWLRPNLDRTVQDGLKLLFLLSATNQSEPHLSAWLPCTLLLYNILYRFSIESCTIFVSTCHPPVPDGHPSQSCPGQAAPPFAGRTPPDSGPASPAGVGQDTLGGGTSRPK